MFYSNRFSKRCFNGRGSKLLYNIHRLTRRNRKPSFGSLFEIFLIGCVWLCTRGGGFTSACVTESLETRLVGRDSLRPIVFLRSATGGCHSRQSHTRVVSFQSKHPRGSQASDECTSRSASNQRVPSKFDYSVSLILFLLLLWLFYS